MLLFLLSFLFFRNAVVVVNGRRMNVAHPAVCGLGGLLRQSNIPIELEGCSVRDEALKCLARQGLFDEFRDGGRAETLAGTVVRQMNELYKANNFFSSYVSGYEISADGSRVTLRCVEHGVPEYNFKFFVRDAEGHEVDVRDMDLVQSSTKVMPRGNFRQESCRALKRVLFCDSKMLVQFDTAVFESLKRTGVWSNLEYAIWRSKDGEYHLYCFCDGPGVTRRINHTLTHLFSKEGAQLRVAFCNLDLLGTKLLTEVGADVAINEWYKMSPRHKVNLSLTYDSLRKGLWLDRVGNTTVATVSANFSAHDLLRLLRLRGRNKGDRSPRALISGSFFVNSWPNRCKFTVAVDAKMVHLKSSRQSYNLTHNKMPVSTQHSLTVKVPICTIRGLGSGLRDRVYVRSHHALESSFRNYDAGISLRLGSNVNHSGFRGVTPNPSDLYVLLSTDVTGSVVRREPWVAIKPGLFLDLLCSMRCISSNSLDHCFKFSAGVMVKILGMGLSLALSEVPLSMPGDLRDFVASLKKSFYMKQATS